MNSYVPLFVNTGSDVGSPAKKKIHLLIIFLFELIW